MSPEQLNQEQPAAKKMKVDTKCVLRWAKLTEQAFEPVRGSPRAAGLDLCSAYNIVVPARGKALVKTDLQVQVPEGSYGRVAPRSGLAVKNFIDVGAGVVDEDYRGNVGVVLFNHSDADFEIKRGDRIAQFICERIFYPELEMVDKLVETERGAGGFGSTGVKELTTKSSNHTKEEAEELPRKKTIEAMDTEETSVKNGNATKELPAKNGNDVKDAEELIPAKNGNVADELPAKNGEGVEGTTNVEELAAKKESATPVNDEAKVAA